MSSAPLPPQAASRVYMLPIRRPVTTAMVFLTLAVFGFQSYRQLPMDLMPDISYPTLTVRTEFEGAAPEDVESLLTRPLEETLSVAGGMVQISSTSSAGRSEVVLEFSWGTDMNAAQQDVRDRLDLFTPPEEVTEKPVILRYDPTLDPVMRVAIAGREFEEIASAEERVARQREQLMLIRDTAERHIKSDLEGELGIAEVDVKGGREEEVQVLMDSDRLKSLGLSLSNVTNALLQQNINLSGGRLKEGKTEFLVRTLNEYQDVGEIAETLIPAPEGRPVRLKDVADVVQGLKQQETIVRLDGREAVELAIYKWGDANTVEVANRLKDLLGFERKPGITERLAESLDQISGRKDAGEEDRKRAPAVRDRLPDFAEMTIISDQSMFIVGAINEVKSTAVLGGVLALIVLYVFLRELKSTLIIGVSIPISIIAAFVPMFLWDVSLNIMSLGGLALGVGMLVDDSIIVLESIFRCREEGDSPVDAADRGTREVFAADASSTFTTIAVFLPIAFVEGVAGQLFGDLALTVTFSLLASLAVALYLIPMLASRRPLAETSTRDVVWMVRAYKERRSAGTGRLASFVAIPWAGLRHGLAGVRQYALAVFTPGVDALRACRPGAHQSAWGYLAPLLLPLVLLQWVFLGALFLVGLGLRVLLSAIVTVAFPVLALFAGIFWLVAKLTGLLLWLPLEIFDRSFRAFRDAYTVGLRTLLPLGPGILILAALLSAHAFYLAAGLGRELIPPLKQGEFGIRMEAPPGTRLEETASMARVIEAEARAMEDIETVAVAIGKEDSDTASDRGENIAQFTLQLANPRETVPRQDAIMDSLRQRLQSKVPADVSFTLPALFSFKTAIEFQIRGDDLQTLWDLGRRMRQAMTGIEGLADVELSIRRGYPEILIELDRDLLAARGLTPESVAQKLRTEVQGDVPTRLSRAGDNIDIRVRTDEKDLSSLEDLKMVNVADTSPPVPLRSVADIRVVEGPSEIRRIDQRRTAVITANVVGRDLGAVAGDIERVSRRLPKPADYQYVLGGQNRELETSYESLQFALLLALFLVYVVMACQFESLHQPFIVMFTAPLAFVGVIYALAVMELDLSIVVFIGGIVLAGVVVNDAIILVDYINQLRQRGLPKREAVVQAGRVRLRPIIITTLTTVLGLAPMAIQTGAGSEIRQPLAITVMAGLTSATVLTLVIIPMVYDLLGGRDKA